MLRSFEEEIEKCNTKYIRVACPFFKYEKSSIIELFIEEGTKLKIKLHCHNHILPIKLYFKYFLNNQYTQKINSCIYHGSKNKTVAFCESCSIDICQICLAHKHCGHLIIKYSNFKLEKKNIIIENQNLLNQIVKLKEAIKKIKDLNREQENLYENIYLFFIIKKIIYLEYIEESKTDNFSYACLKNLEYIRAQSSDITMKKIENLLNLNCLDQIFQLNKSSNKDYLLSSENIFNSEEIFETKEIKLKTNSKFIDGNNEYFIAVCQNISIYSIKENKFLFYLEENDTKDIILFHPTYLNLFLTSSNNIIKIWEINKDNRTAKKLINKKIMDDFENIQFIPFRKNGILIINNNEIKILDLHNLDNKIVLNFQTSIDFCEFSQNGTILGCLEENLLTCYKFENDNIHKIISIPENCSKFYIRNINNNLNNNINNKNYNLILVNFYSIKYYNNILSDEFEKIQALKKISSSYYDNEYDFLYLFSDMLIVLRISDWSRIIKINNFYLYPLNCLTNKNSPIIQEFISLDNNRKKILTRYSFSCPKLFNGNIPNEEESISNKYNLENEIIRNKDYNQKLSFNSDIIDKKEISKKKYLKIPEIEKELEDNYKYSLSKKKEIAENELKIFNEDGTIFEQYIKLIKILIKDNINKNILIKYLKFLKKNDEKLKPYENIIEFYSTEIKYYSVCFTPKELMDNFYYKKKNDEKSSFIHFIKKISQDTRNIDLIISKLKKVKNNLSTFNQPIDFNNKELYFYMNKAIISLEMLKYENKVEKIKKIQSSIKIIIEKDLFNDKDIINDESKLSKLIFIILRGQTSILAEYNLNILKQKESTDEEKKLAMSKIDNISWLKIKMVPGVKADVSKIEINKLDKKYNFSNILLCLKAGETFEDYELYNHENLIHFFEEKINIDKVKMLMKKIILSNCIKDAFSLLYDKKSTYPFNTEDEASNFIENYIDFIYLKDESAKGATNKFTLQTKIFLMTKESKYPNEIILYKCLYPVSLIKVFLHELNHEFYNFYYFHSNGSIPLSTPRKKNIEEREGGRYFEFLLFGQKLKTINLIQAIYLLNEKNYEKSLSDFRQDFLSPKEEDLFIQGEFNFLNIEISELIKRKENLSEYIIKTDDDELNLLDITLDVDVDNDVLGSYFGEKE